MADEKRRLRDEVAELSEAVRELRAQLAQRDHHCHGHCVHWHYTSLPYYPTTYAPYVNTCGTGNVSASAAPVSGTISYASALTQSGASNYSNLS